MASLTIPVAYGASDVRRALRDLEARLQRFDRAILVADWDLYTGRSGAGTASLQLRRGQMLRTPGLLEWVREALRRTGPGPLHRRLELLERAIVVTLAEQAPEIVRLRSELQRTIVAYRPRWDGRRVNRAVVREVARNDPDPKRRRRAYLALDPLHRSLEGRFLDLVRLRNGRARELGFQNVAEMQLGFEGLTVARFEELAAEATSGVVRHARRLRDSLSPKERDGGWEPWDYFYALRRLASPPEEGFPTREMLPRILRAVARWGFPVHRMRFRVVFHDLPAGGLTLAPDPPRDVRILVHPRGGWEAYHVMFHEVGHAVHSASVRAPGHLLRWHENIPGAAGFHEGIGGLFEEIPRDPAWLRQDAGVDPALAERFARVRQRFDLFGAAWLRFWVTPELRLYARPDRDPMPEARRLERSLMGYDGEDPRSFVDPFFVESPIYAPNYLLALLFHYQLAETVRRELGEPLWPNRSVGPWLTRNWFAEGSLFDWAPRLREVSGRPFGARAFRSHFRAG
jgi:hypothetical protein